MRVLAPKRGELGNLPKNQCRAAQEGRRWGVTRVALMAVAAIVSSLVMFPHFACAQTPDRFLLGISSDGTGFGSIQFPGWGDCPANTGVICYQYIAANSTVILTALPEADSVLGGWSGACSGTGTCQVTMDANKMVTATINARPGTNYLIGGVSSSDNVGQGTITSSPAGINCRRDSGSCRANFPSDTVVTLTAAPDSGSMLAGWSGACTGTGTCQVAMTAKRSVYATFAVASPTSLNFTALWWDPAESGWGINLNHQGNTVFATLFTYDSSGAPLWLVMSAGRRISPANFYFEGALFRTTGPPFNASPFTPISEANITTVGRMGISFQGTDTALLSYDVNGVVVQKRIRKQIYGSRAADCSSTTANRATSGNYQDLWWNPAESGWGINVTHQDDTLFATLFTYDASGRDLWLVMSAGRKQADGSYFGDLYRTRGPPFNANPFTPIGGEDVVTVGTMRLRFADGNNGTLTYTYNGAPVTKSITRQLFSSPVPLCK